MSKQVRVTIETAWVGASEEIIIEVEDNASPNDIDEAAHEEFLNYCSYGWSFVEENEEE